MLSCSPCGIGLFRCRNKRPPFSRLPLRPLIPRRCRCRNRKKNFIYSLNVFTPGRKRTATTSFKWRLFLLLPLLFSYLFIFGGFDGEGNTKKWSFGGVKGGSFYFLLDFFIYLLFVSEFAGGQRRLVSKLYSVLAVGIYFFCLALGIFLYLSFQFGNRSKISLEIFLYFFFIFKEKLA